MTCYLKLDMSDVVLIDMSEEQIKKSIDKLKTFNMELDMSHAARREFIEHVNRQHAQTLNKDKPLHVYMLESNIPKEEHVSEHVDNMSVNVANMSNKRTSILIKKDTLDMLNSRRGNMSHDMFIKSLLNR